MIHEKFVSLNWIVIREKHLLAHLAIFPLSVIASGACVMTRDCYLALNPNTPPTHETCHHYLEL